MIEPVSGALAWLWAVCISLRCLLVDVRRPAPRPLTSSQPVGREYRMITPLPRGRVFALQVRLVIA
jgi:hypothetical protein